MSKCPDFLYLKCQEKLCIYTIQFFRNFDRYISSIYVKYPACKNFHKKCPKIFHYIPNCLNFVIHIYCKKYSKSNSAFSCGIKYDKKI
jgi:hypothetical protein